MEWPSRLIDNDHQDREGECHEVTVEEKRWRTEEVDPSFWKPEAENKRDGKMELAYAKVMKEDNGKYKVALSFKLASNIKKPTDLKHVLESRILDSDVEFTRSSIK